MLYRWQWPTADISEKYLWPEIFCEQSDLVLVCMLFFLFCLCACSSCVLACVCACVYPRNKKLLPIPPSVAIIKFSSRTPVNPSAKEGEATGGTFSGTENTSPFCCNEIFLQCNILWRHWWNIAPLIASGLPSAPRTSCHLACRCGIEITHNSLAE